MSCSMQQCSNCRRLKPEGISFYTFPRGKLQELWLMVCGKYQHNWTWSSNKVVCSKHFRPEDIIQKGTMRYLKSNAVPVMVVVEAGSSENTTFNKTTTTVDTSSSTDSGEPRLLKRKMSQTTKIDTTSSTEASEPQSDSSGTKRRKIEHIKLIHNYRDGQ